jgi:uncharacterized protein (DUF362 family)
MTSPRYHPIYSQNATVHVVTGADKLSALDRALAWSDFADHLERRYLESGKSREAFSIAIKANIMTASVHEDDSPVYTDPALVEALVAIVRDRGFRTIAVVESHNVYDYSYQGRTVGAVAEMAGYSQNGYQVRDLSEEKVAFDYGGVLGVHVAGQTWRDADYRVSFAKNKTHWQCFYTACIKNVYGCLPEWDKMRHYHGTGIEFRDAHPNLTRTIFASDNIFALDWVAGEKMGLDPIQNFVMQEALHTWGPIRITREGDMTPWRSWQNVRRFPVVLLAWLEEWYHVSRFFSRAMAAHQDERFPPVPTGQGLFRFFQRVTRIGERLLTRKAPTRPPTPKDPAMLPMDPSSIGLIEAFVADLVKWLGVVVALGLVAGAAWNLPRYLTGAARVSVLGGTAVVAVVMIVGGLRGKVRPAWLTTSLALGCFSALLWVPLELMLGTPVPAALFAALAAGLAGMWSIHRRASKRRLRHRRVQAVTEPHS